MYTETTIDNEAEWSMANSELRLVGYAMRR
jgi:hypothetical protein